MRVRCFAPIVRLAMALFAAASASAASLDVPTPYIPSTRGNVDEMLRLANVTPQDVVFDLGSGDGRIVIAAAHDYGARGIGIELDAALVRESTENARRAGVGERVEFRHSDIFAADLRAATVVTMYLLTSLVNKLEPKLLAELRPGTRIVAHDYGFAEWQPDRKVQISKSYLLYIVPAKVAGAWRLEAPITKGREFVLDLQQRYQEVRGGVRVQGGFLPAFEARVSGERVRFVLVEDDVSYRFEGDVRGDGMEGVVRYGSGPQLMEQRWRAQRAAAAASLP
ncbi:MAG: methyltransferase domain-containing protein [Burkholderiales bacterium]